MVRSWGHSRFPTFGHPAITLSGTFATFSNGGRNTFRPLDQNLVTFGDTLTWIVGKHDFRMGGDVVRNAAVDGFALNRGEPTWLDDLRWYGHQPVYALSSRPSAD